MSYDFSSQRSVKGRKLHRCEQCTGRIEIGEEHIYYAGKWDGYFYAGREHFQCQEARAAYVEMADLHWDEVPFLHEIDEPSDQLWLAEKYPAIAEACGFAKGTMQ
jgi:hypothetical protein